MRSMRGIRRGNLDLRRGKLDSLPEWISWRQRFTRRTLVFERFQERSVEQGKIGHSALSSHSSCLDSAISRRWLRDETWLISMARPQVGFSDIFDIWLGSKSCPWYSQRSKELLLQELSEVKPSDSFNDRADKARSPVVVKISGTHRMHRLQIGRSLDKVCRLQGQPAVLCHPICHVLRKAAAMA